MVLVHGLYNGPWIMALLGRRLKACGFSPRPFGYPSVREDLDANAERLRRFAGGARCFAGHSLGGLVILRALEMGMEARRAVLLGTPYRGSCVARKAAALPLGRRILGKSLLQFLERGPPPPPGGVEVGVIAGTLGIGIGALFGCLKRPHDGMVAAEEARIPGAPLAKVRAAHLGLLFSRQAAELTCAFLREGRFGG